MERVDGAKIFLEDMKQKSFTNLCSDLDPELVQHLKELQKVKKDAKLMASQSASVKLQLYEHLRRDPATWPTVPDADKALKDSCKTRSKVKEEIEDEKNKIEQLCETAQDGYQLLQQNIKTLEDKIKTVTEKKIKLEAMRTKTQEARSAFGNVVQPGQSYKDLKTQLENKLQRVESAIGTCEMTMKQAQQEVEGLHGRCQQLKSAIEENNLKSHHIIASQRELLSGLSDAMEWYQNLVSFLETMGGVREHPVGSDKIQLEIFQQNEEDSLSLYVELTFEEDNIGFPRLQNAEISSSSLYAEDLIEEAVEKNDVCMLVTNLKQRWQSYYPLLSEVTKLTETHAIDWIQTEGLLRVLVGKGGSIVCTLRKPEDYPRGGDITLVDIQGLPSELSSTESLKPPRGQENLTGWVEFLEEKFGKP